MKKKNRFDSANVIGTAKIQLSENWNYARKSEYIEHVRKIWKMAFRERLVNKITYKLKQFNMTEKHRRNNYYSNYSGFLAPLISRWWICSVKVIMSISSERTFPWFTCVRVWRTEGRLIELWGQDRIYYLKLLCIRTSDRNLFVANSS